MPKNWNSYYESSKYPKHDLKYHKILFKYTKKINMSEISLKCLKVN